MDKKELRIVFMGTPEFAVPSLQILVEEGYNVVGVITAPDRKSGRGQKISKSAVKEYAETQNLNILQPTNLKDEAFLDELKSLNANLQVVVAFRMLPVAVWDMPEIGTFNLHASLLPNYRGAAPINWAIMNGEKETGATTFFLKHKIDTGDIILQQKEEITKDDTAGTLYARLMLMGAQLVLKTVKLVEEEKVESTPQILTGEEKSAPKIFKDTCEIDWTQDGSSIRNFIRGLSPYPAAWTKLNNKTIKVFEADFVHSANSNVENGEIDSDNKSYLAFGCKDGVINIKSLQMEGKKRNTIEEFLRGYNVNS